MEKANFGQIVSFLFGIANDCLVDTYDVGDYRKIILPMMVIRRFDAVLEPTKEKVLKMKEQLDAAGITDQDEALCSVAGEAFCNSSPYTLSDLKSRTNQQQLKSDFILYLNGFSQNVQDIIKRFEFRNQIDKLSEHDILGLLISKFTDSSVNLSNRPIYDAKGNLVQPALDNHTMGTVFEEVIRKFNEETNISSKNADYYAAEAYLTFEHDEFTMKPTLDENGRFIPRKDYRISTLNCRDEDFAIACLRANLRYGKNQKREDVKSHHYIISFDPKDVPDHGLTVDLAQSLGEKFCKEHFPGHQAIVCTHPDGHNGSGNVHVHIVINSLRIEEVPFMPYMDRSCDTRPGMKHRCTNAAMEYFRSEVMEMCHDAGLYQIDLLNGSKTRVTEREYWAKKKGQLALDEENAVLAEQGLPVKQTKFETDKDKLREEIRMALSDAVSFEDFAEKLLRRGITVKESRGRLSYLTPDRTKPITARKLGDDFDKAAVFAIFVRNTKRVRAKTDTIHSAPAMQKIINERDTVSRMVDIDAAKEKGKGYEHWAKKHNLKNASRAYLLYKEMGFDSPEALATACDAAHEKLSDIRTEMKSVEATIAEKKELRNHVLNYHKTRYVIDEMKACKNEKARQKYRDEHDSDFIILNTAKCYFDSKGLKKLPSHKALQTEVEQLIKEKNELYNQYQTAKEEAQRLGTIRHNLEQTLGRKIEHKKEQER